MSRGMWWGLGAVAIVLIAWFGLIGPNQGPVQAAWLDGETSFDLGDVPFGGGVVTRTLALTHAGDEPIEIKDMFSNCGCTTAEIEHGPHHIGPFGMPGHGSSMMETGMMSQMDWSIMPGDDFIAKIAFDPAAHGEESIGERVMRKVTIKTNAGEGVITFTAHVV